MNWRDLVFWISILATIAGGAYGVDQGDKYLMILYASPGLIGILLLILFLGIEERLDARRRKVK